MHQEFVRNNGEIRVKKVGMEYLTNQALVTICGETVEGSNPGLSRAAHEIMQPIVFINWKDTLRLRKMLRQVVPGPMFPPLPAHLQLELVVEEAERGEGEEGEGLVESDRGGREQVMADSYSFDDFRPITSIIIYYFAFIPLETNC